MLVCNLCGTEKATKREMHGHLIRMHYEVYKAKGCDMTKFVTMDAETEEEVKQERKKKKPAGFRFLNRTNELENAAYKEGYRYTDGETVWTEEEARKKGWI